MKLAGANELTLESFETGWLKESTIQSLVLLANRLGGEVDVVIDGNVRKARFDVLLHVFQSVLLMNKSHGYQSRS